jgi:hypothetical protein
MFDFIDIPNNKDRTQVIQEYCRLIRQGDYSLNEQKELRHELVSDYLIKHCMDNHC